MNYDLKTSKQVEKKKLKVWLELASFIKFALKPIVIALIFVLINSAITVISPFIIGDATDKYIPNADRNGLYMIALVLIVLYAISFITNYLQIVVMGKVGQRILFKVRNTIFEKLQSLPLAFFNANNSGDLIARINNDTDKLNQAFSETLLRFIGQIFIIIGTGVIMLVVNIKLGLIALGIAALLFLLTYLVSPLINRANKKSLEKNGELSAEVQENLSNFKVIVAFGRRDFFRKKFSDVNELNRVAATRAGIANTILTPVYDFGAAIAGLIVLLVSINMLLNGEITFGVVLSYILYVDRFFSPLRILAQLFSNIQTSLAAWSRINAILILENNLEVTEESEKIISNENIVLKFDNVSFGYEENVPVITDLNIEMLKGKTYAFVGPTGGGKSTTASLIARLYDPTQGEIYLEGRNLKSFSRDELAEEIGFILQEPFLFTGTIGENIAYANKTLEGKSNEEIKQVIDEMGLSKVMDRFKNGLETEVNNNSENISLGQKQLVAFLRALLRKPKLLILDEATANIDTVTENLLEAIIDKMPSDTTKVVIAHRLNTIEKADQIFFVAGGKIDQAMSFEDAVKKIKHTDNAS